MRWIVLLVAMMLLLSCSAPAGLDSGKRDVKEETEEVEETEKEEEKEETEEEKEDPDEGLPERPSGLELDDRIDITLGSGDAAVEGTVKGKYERFKKDYDDLDALIFDASEVFGVTIYEARYMTYVDGSRHLRPSEIEEVDEEISELEDPELDIDYIEYHETYETGFIRGIGCDRAKGLVILDIQQDDTQDHGIWRDVKPRVRNAIVFRLNKKVLENIYCEDDEGDAQDNLVSGEHYTCRKSNVRFVEDLQGTLADNIDRGDLQNEVVAGIPGRNEVLYFSCLGDAPVDINSTDNSTEDNSTNSTA